MINVIAPLLAAGMVTTPPRLALNRRALFSAAAPMSAVGLTALSLPSFAGEAPSFAQLSAQASSAFQKADYVGCERLWREAAATKPDEPIAYANLAVALVINASDEMQLGVAPTGKARERLVEAIEAIDKAEGLGKVPDPLNLNTKGNALGLLQRWEDARAAYAVATAASPRDFESIPRSNEALVLFELGSLAEAERIAKTLVRRDPGFRDGQALLAALRFEQGDRAGAANSISELCSGVSGSMWCSRYSSVDVVLGRWTPKAVDAYRRMIEEPSVKLELKNGLSR
jgi:tetratricopeptide (TPR) repeat protein